MGTSFIEDELLKRSNNGILSPMRDGDTIDGEIGSETPTTGTFSPLRILNDIWMVAKNYAGSVWVNMFKVSEDDEIIVGATLVTGSTEAEEDSGAITIFDMPVSNTPAVGDEMSATFKIDGNNILKVYAEADSAGGIQNPAIISEQQLNLKEITTPTAIANYGAIYVKSDNKLYFQDGAGVEYTVTIV